MSEHMTKEAREAAQKELCANCGHPLYNHMQAFTEIVGFCQLGGDCPCNMFVKRAGTTMDKTLLIPTIYQLISLLEAYETEKLGGLFKIGGKNYSLTFKEYKHEHINQ